MSSNQLLKTSIDLSRNPSIKGFPKPRVIIVSKPHKVKKGSAPNLEDPKPNWNERFVLEKIPVYTTIPANKPTTMKKSRSITQIERTKKVSFERKGDVNGIKETSKFPQTLSQSNFFGAKTNEHGKEIKEETKYSGNPIVQSYLKQKEKLAAYDLIGNPRIVEEYLEQLQTDINLEWTLRQIPHFHRKAFSSCIQSLPKIQIIDIVFQELKMLRRDKSQIQICIKVVKAREICLESIKEQIEKLSSENLETKATLIYTISETLKDLRILSLEVVEYILRWRETLLSYYNQSSQTDSSVVPSKPPPINLIYEDSNKLNYLLKMREDLNFLSNSEYTEYANVAKPGTLDPFLILLQSERNNQGGMSENNSQVKPVVHNCQHLMKRLRASEAILFEESIRHRINQAYGTHSATPVKLRESELQEFIQSNTSNIHTGILECFKVESAVLAEEIRNKSEPIFLQILSNSSLQQSGFAIAHVESVGIDAKKRCVKLLFAGSIDVKAYPNILRAIADYIFVTDLTCEAINVELKYSPEQITNEDQQDIKMTLFQQIKDSYIQLGFKQKQQNNSNIDGNPSIILSLARYWYCNSKSKKSMKHGSKEVKPHIQLTGITILSSNSKSDLIETNNDNDKKQLIVYYDTPYHTAKLLSSSQNINTHTVNDLTKSKLTNKQEDLQTSSNVTQETSSKIASSISAAFGNKEFEVCGTSATEKCQHIQRISQLYSQVLPQSPPIDQFNLQPNSLVCITKCAYQWKQATFASIENKEYIRFPKVDDQEKAIQRCYSSKDNSVERSIFLIPTNEPTVKAYIMEINESNLEKIKNGEQNLSSFVVDVIVKCDSQEVCSSEVWIPAAGFSSEVKTIFEDYATGNSVLSSMNFSFECKSEFKQGIEFNAPSNDSQQSVWKSPFIFGLIEEELSEKVDFPLFSCIIE